MKSYYILTLAFLFLLLTGLNYLIAEITVDPFGFTASLDENAEQEVDLNLSNTGENEVTFRMSYKLESDNDERRGGPRRDELGEILHEFDVPNGGANQQKVGVAWDWENEWMWISNNPNSSVVAVDPDDDYEVVREIDVQNPFNVTCLYGHLYIINNSINRIYHFDTEGENLGTINLGYNISSITRSEELGLLFITEDSDRTIHVFTVDDNGEPDEEIGVIPCLADLCGDENRYRAICWVDLHQEGQFWLTNPSAQDRGGRLWNVLIDTDEWEPVEVVDHCEIWPNCGNNRQRFGIGHDFENMWCTAYNSSTVRIIDDGVVEFDMLTIDPEEGSVQGNNSETVNIDIITEGYEAGVYNILIEIELEEAINERDDFEEASIEISAVVSIASPTYNISGIVTNAVDDSPVEDAFVESGRYMIGVHSDGEGNYAFTDLPPGEYELTFTATDFLSTTETVNLEEDDIELNTELLHARCIPSRDDFTTELEPDMEHEFEFQVTNSGNGPLRWMVERNIPEVPDLDMWELRSNQDIQEIVEDEMLNGVVFIDECFYVSGGNDGENPNRIYILNRDFEQVGGFDQFAEDRYGMRDLVYDGELLWGAVEGTFYGFTTEGDSITSFDIDIGIEGRALAWDPENELLWASDISTNIIGINREGEVVRTVENEDLRIYGLGFWPDDPDGYNLYVFCRGPENEGISLYKINIENDEYREVAYLGFEDGRPGGMNITNQFDVYSWVLIGIAQNPDEIGIWQIATNYEWFRIAPEEGVIEANEDQEFTLILDATNLPLDMTFEGELVYTHDGIGGETILDVELRVVEGRVQTSRDIELHIGWNTISTNLQPNDHDDVEGLVSDLVDNEQLIMMKNGYGDFYRPEYEFNNIETWNSWEGFQMLMSEATTLTLEGESVLRDDPIELVEGWQLISYYPRFPIETTTALSRIVEHLVIAKDGYGNFYLPAWDDFCNMGEMRPGQGYFINMDADMELVYEIEGMNEEERFMVESPLNLPFTKGGNDFNLCQSDLDWLSGVQPTETSYSLLLLTEGFEAGTRLEGYTPDGKHAGRGIVGSDGRCGMALWGKFLPTQPILKGGSRGDLTFSKEGNDVGFSDGEEITIIASDNRAQQAGPCELEWLDGDITGWKSNGWGVASIKRTVELPQEFGIVSTYPNPFNSSIMVSYNLSFISEVRMQLFEITGREVETVFSEWQNAGSHTVVIDNQGLSAGLYLIRLKSGSEVAVRKIVLVK